jgi:predicted alpha/beta superfamily hydrolase
MEAVKTAPASQNVWIIDNAFYIPQLHRYRRIWLYLPEDYSRSRRAYPVLYMHDGQNLFEGWSSFAGEWGVDETLDALKARCIVVGIDNGGDRRMNEYSYHDNEHGPAEGKQYLQFIVETLKPHIDKTYRTLEDRANTYMAGSSMGGLISFYACLHYPAQFGGAGVFSPSFWLVPGIREDVLEMATGNSEYRQRFFFYAGGKEGEGLADGVRAMAELLREQGQYSVEVKVDPGGKHEEAAWGKQFARFYRWMMKKQGNTHDLTPNP